VAPAVPTAVAAAGYTEVAIGSSADIIATYGAWVASPATSPGPGGWLNSFNAAGYTTDGTGPTGTPYNMTLSRSFRMCIADSITLDLYIANDNYISSLDVDGTLTTFSQPAIASAATFTSFTHFTQTIYLSAGTHTMNVVVNNYNSTGTTYNPTGMDINGTVSSASGITSLVSESFASCAAYACSSTCNALSLPDTLRPCAGGTLVLPAVLTGPDSVLSISWAPVTGLSNDSILDPTLTVGLTSAMYYINVQSLIPFNFVANGDFSAGNTGFTSSYIYSPPPSTTLIEGDYSVYTNPFGVHTGFTSMGDHTTGTGEMMIINGGSSPTDVWCETIPVLPNTNYQFSAWFADCSSITVGADVPIIQFKINGVLIASPVTVSSPVGVWDNLFVTWNSGISTTATICIYDLNTTAAGNDFALDDISFRQICVTEDSVFIADTPNDTLHSSSDTTLCILAAPITLTAPAGYTSYLWNTGAVTPTIPAFGTTAYWVYNTLGCTILIDTFNVHYIPLPVLALVPDTAFCIGNTITLSSIQPAGTTYLWSTGSTDDSIHVSTSGIYWLQLNNGCVVTDTSYITVSPYPIVDLGPDTSNCTGTPFTLMSSVSYTAPTYLWSTGSAAPAITVPLSGTYSLQVTVGGCAAMDSIHVNIYFDTFTLSNVDTAICMGAGVQVALTANPSATFQWLPTAGIAASTTITPWIEPDTSALYFVNIYLPGCAPLKDSFYIDVQPNPTVYLGGERSVCQFDTIHLHAYVNPAWYAHYIYSWSPTTNLDTSTSSEVVFTGGDSTQLVLTVTTPAHIAGTATCIGADSAFITVHPGNFAALDTNYTLCPGDSVQLMPTGGVSYRWRPVMYLSDSTSATPWVHAITTMYYNAVATSQYGCLDTVGVSVMINPRAVISLPDSVTLYPGESYQLSPGSNCESFAWFPPSGLSDAYISNPLATPAVSTRYIVTGKNEWGCIAVDSITINVNENTLLAIPNAFTPGAQVNGKLYILKRGEATLSYFRIFNRWGNKVFETNNIEDGWDGSYNGAPQPLGVYVYEIEATTNTGALFEKHGNVTLIR